LDIYKKAWVTLLQRGVIYPSPHSRKDVERALSAPHEGDVEVIFPASLRPEYMQDIYSPTSEVDDKNNNDDINKKRGFDALHEPSSDSISISSISLPELFQRSKRKFHKHSPQDIAMLESPTAVNWRFRVPDDFVIRFHDELCGDQQFTTTKDFGDFLVWRADGFPSYELAVVVDDHDMQVS
jgi:glutamyl-tRNA synthetase